MNYTLLRLSPLFTSYRFSYSCFASSHITHFTHAHRCEWCGITAHPACHKSIPPECNFGTLEPIYLPPHCVSIPRTEISMETIVGVAKKAREPAANIRKSHYMTHHHHHQHHLNVHLIMFDGKNGNPNLHTCQAAFLFFFFA